MKRWIALSVTLIFMGCSHKEVSLAKKQEAKFFSMKAIESDSYSKLEEALYCNASDQIPLAYRKYSNKKTDAVLIFYHGAGVNSSVGYNHLANRISAKFPITVITPDLRGHGLSKGVRGDTPSKEQLYKDINTLIQVAKIEYPNTPIFLGAHSAGGGLLINYTNFEERMEVSGYLLVAPYLGYKAEVEYPKEKQDVMFSTINVSPFVMNQMSFGIFDAHTPAIKFYYPPHLFQQYPKLLASNSVELVNAFTPMNPEEEIQSLVPLAVLIAEKDEVYSPSKMGEFLQKNRGKILDTSVKTFVNQTHFSILIEADDFMGEWIESKI